MTEALLTFSGTSILSERLNHKSKITLHWILQTIAVVCSTAGFVIIIIHKNDHHKLHFQSIHGIIGLIATILFLLSSFGGIFAKYAMRFKHMMRPINVKLIHTIAGVVAYILGMYAILLGLFTGWFTRVTGNSSVIIWLCFAFVLAVGLHAILNPLRVIYSRLKTACV